VAFDLAIAVCSFVLIGTAALRPIETTPHLRLLGCGLVAVPLPAVVAFHLAVLHSGRLDQALFVAGLVAFALGAVLVLGRDGRSGGEPPEDDPGPHWWPDFERDFEAHVRSLQRHSRRLVRL